MGKKINSAIFKIAKWLLWIFYPKIKIEGIENLPKDEPVIIVGNHSQMHGPIACELYFTEKRYTWCVGQMMHLKEVPAYAFKDFWSHKPKCSKWFYKLASYIIAPLSVFIFRNANTIAVYKDKRILGTFKNTLKKLEEGNSIVIFPEYDKKYNNIIYDFQDKFIDIAKLYYKKTGTQLRFVPLYITPKMHKMYLGKPIEFCAGTPIRSERKRIREYLMKQICEIAYALPPHTVVPYRNIAKRDYPKNILQEAKPNKK